MGFGHIYLKDKMDEEENEEDQAVQGVEMCVEICKSELGTSITNLQGSGGGGRTSWRIITPRTSSIGRSKQKKIRNTIYYYTQQNALKAIKTHQMGPKNLDVQ